MMAVPTYDKFIEPVLRFLALHPVGVPAKEAHIAAADSLGVSEQIGMSYYQVALNSSTRIEPDGRTTV